MILEHSITTGHRISEAPGKFIYPASCAAGGSRRLAQVLLSP